MHFKEIAKAHLETKFVSIDVEKSPFFVDKLGIQTLPTIIYFQDGVSYDRITGFQGVADHDDFDTLLLSRRLVNCGAIKALNKAEEGRTRIRGSKYQNWSDSDSD